MPPKTTATPTDAPAAEAGAPGTDLEPTPTEQALAANATKATPKALVLEHRKSFEAVLPSQITRPETWLRVAQGALRKGKLYNGGPFTELEVAANNNPGVFLATLLDAARLGLEPGTDQFYLTPREVKGRLEILGIVGYQGYIELMYRSGLIASVVAENVHRHDQFAFRPGRDDVPDHEIDWDADDRGELRLVYAFARMKGGATSKVVVLNRQAIETIKRSAQNPTGKYSPWRNHEPAMWLKSSVRQLRKWVPTSPEDRNEQMRTRAAALDEADRMSQSLQLEIPVGVSDTYSDDEPVDAELVDDTTAPADAGQGEQWDGDDGLLYDKDNNVVGMVAGGSQ